MDLAVPHHRDDGLLDLDLDARLDEPLAQPLAEADRAAQSPILAAPVDVLIATYNEPFDILERTIVARPASIHPDLRVWVLDDGARHWVRELAGRTGRITSPRQAATARQGGNVNNGLAHALSTGREPEFVLLLDADFTVSRNILRRTLGCSRRTTLRSCKRHSTFSIPTRSRAGLLCAASGRTSSGSSSTICSKPSDAWGAAFCCGTSAVIRVTALEASAAWPPRR